MAMNINPDYTNYTTGYQQDYIKEVASPEERRQKIKGCGLLIGEPSKINVYAVCTQFPQKREA